MASRILHSIKTQIDFFHNDFLCHQTIRVFSFLCSYTLYLFGLLSRLLPFRNEASRNLYEYESNSDEVLHKQEDQSQKHSNRYEYSCGKHICRFVEEPTNLRFTIHESVLDSKFGDSITNPRIFYTNLKDMQKIGLDAEETDEAEDFFPSALADDEVDTKFIERTMSDEQNLICDENDFGNHEFGTEKTKDFVVKGEIDELEHEDEDLKEIKLLSECDAEEESVCSNDEIHEEIESVNSISNGVCGIGFVLKEEEEDNKEMEAIDSDDEYIELHPKKQDSDETSSRQETTESEEECSLCEDKTSDFQIQKETDYLVEHDNLIQQLKMELNLSRTGGLPTIFEESESQELETPKTILQHLRPLKMDDRKLDFKHLLDDIRKVYRNYSDKMRKLDILNFQTMHALGLHETKGSVDFERARKSSVTAIMSLLSSNLWLCKGSAVIEPMRKVIADMHRDFENVYIGQICLSWEILQWQYAKALEMQNYVSSHRFNQVAGEFQLFQVLVQRFLENEQFQGPRIHNYVNNRCVLRSLLQVPLLRDDDSKDKGKRGHEGNEDAITSQMLPAIIEQSIKVFWEFIRADKDDHNLLFQGHMQSHLVDFEVLTDVRMDFQKKEKKLKDVLRSGNCIVKRFRKQKGEDYGVDQKLLTAQVELKLVAKVLNMSKLTTEKLIWCHERLDKIKVCNGKVFVECSILLFPC